MNIVPFCSKWAKAVGDLIVPIQRKEFGINISYDDQPDLHDIAAFYQHGLGGFWLALDDDELVGTIALKDIGDGASALRKMFVKESHRGGRHWHFYGVVGNSCNPRHKNGCNKYLFRHHKGFQSRTSIL